MRIAYLINHDISKNDGVTKKILSQINSWKQEGHGVEVFCTTPSLGDSILPAKQYLFSSYIKSRLKVNDELVANVKQYSPSIIYFRYDTWSKTLSLLMKEYKVITELNTNDLDEYYLLMKKERSLKAILRYLSYYFLRSKVLANVSGIVSVTKEIMHLPSVKKFRKPSEYIPNGIDISKFHVVKEGIEERTGLFFIGTPNQPWHGIDLIEIIASKLPEFDFHIVGVDGVSQSNIYYYGYLVKDEYVKILKKCHICIGSLALFRNNMSEACPLKVREYLANGFPTVVGYNETAFLNQETPSWFKKIDVENLNEIKKFVIENRDVILSHEDVVRYIDSKMIEKKRLQFFASFLDD
jgi:glycosyltransferase involved in cell wall biosynthesis